MKPRYVLQTADGLEGDVCEWEHEGPHRRVYRELRLSGRVVAVPEAQMVPDPNEVVHAREYEYVGRVPLYIFREVV